MHAAVAVRRWVLWVGMVASLLLLMCQMTFGQNASAVLKRVDGHYNRLRTLRTRFVERYTGMGMVREESGTLLLAKPGRMRWSYDKPVGKVYVMDGKFGWSYTPGDTQVQRIAAKKIDDLRSPLRLLLGHTVLEKELPGATVKVDGSGFVIAGVPRGMGARVQRLTLRVDVVGRIEAIQLEEVDGARTEFSFSEMKENEATPAGTFVFAVPAGVAVVDGLPPL